MEFELFDGDNHYYEPADCFTRYQEPTLADRHRIHWATSDSGKPRLMVGDQIARYISNPTFDPVARPGGLTTMFEDLHSGTVPEDDGDAAVDPLLPDSPFRDRAARLKAMDEQGVRSIILLPTLALTLEDYMVHDAKMTAANLHAFNRWLDEDWGFDFEGRIFGVPLISLLDVDAAVAELQWVLGRGAKMIHIRSVPVNGRSPADTHFDPFWSVVNESGVGVALHASNSGFARYSADWGEDPHNPAFFLSPFQHATTQTHRPIYETIGAMVFHNLFGRFPNIRVASIEQGATWVDLAFQEFDKSYHLGRRNRTELPALPTEIMKQHVFLSPFPEEDVAHYIELLGVDRVMMGSDWPHTEGLVQPADYVHALDGLGADVRHKVMHENAGAFVGV
jgi:predicted TIM-barrel fold metal-dependent hydrolase